MSTDQAQVVDDISPITFGSAETALMFALEIRSRSVARHKRPSVPMGARVMRSGGLSWDEIDSLADTILGTWADQRRSGTLGPLALAVICYNDEHLMELHRELLREVTARHAVSRTDATPIALVAILRVRAQVHGDKPPYYRTYSDAVGVKQQSLGKARRAAVEDAERYAREWWMAGSRSLRAALEAKGIVRA